MGFNSWMDFEHFEKKVKHENRYVHSEDVKEFLFNIKNRFQLGKEALLQVASYFVHKLDMRSMRTKGN